MKYDYIVIEREYGSGGREIGKLLGERLNIPCYGEEIPQGVAEKLNIPLDEVQKHEESTTSSLLYSLYALSQMGNVSGDMLSKDGLVFVEEQKLIHEYALKGSAVFVGRCAQKPLENGKVLTVFIHADIDSRKRRAVSKYGISEGNAAGVIARYDKKRDSYYRLNTSKKWKSFDNYDMALDSGKLGIEACVDIIAAACQ